MNAKDLIEQLGGAAVLAKKLGYDSYNGQRRINNWKTRGIPARIILEHPKIFRGYKCE